MTQHDALLAAVCAAPDDDLPRLVYADWCDENGQPERAEFIRVQIEIANGAKGKRLAALQKREKELLAQHEAKWIEPLQEFTDDFFSDPFRFRRGFVEDISIDDELLEENGDELFASAPIRTLRMGDQDGFNDLHKCKHLLRITTLDVTYSSLDDEYRKSAKFFGSKYLANLTTLIARGIDDNGHLDAGGLKAIAESKHLRRLRRLDIGDNWLFEDDSARMRTRVAGQLTALGQLPKLSELFLDGIGLPPSVVQQFSAQRWLRRLKTLDLHQNHSGDDGGRALAESPHLKNIEVLDLRDNDNFDEEGDDTPLSDEVKRLLKRRFGERVRV